MEETILFGNRLLSDVPVKEKSGKFALVGTRNGKPAVWPIDENTLSRHFLFLGAIGTGKTNAINRILCNIRNTMTTNDVMLIFDTKGDYYRSFYRRGDIVISNDSRATGSIGTDYWNIFREVMIDSHWEENTTEIVKTIFADRLEKTTQVFFPNAAKDLFAALILDICRTKERPERQNNESLLHMLQTISSERMISLLKKHRDMQSMISYIQDPNSGQTLGVLSELQSVVRELFVGNFSKKGNLSIRDLIRHKGGKAIFIEYDLGIGGVLTPIYRLLFDLGIKEALCRERNEGNVYFVMDEFSLLPRMKHIDDGVNFGRSLGARFIVGAQNVSQIYDAYGENRGNSLLSGFSTTVCFKLNDGKSREFFKDLNGKNGRLTSFSSSVHSRGVTDQYREAFVVEDHDIDDLKVGEAIVHTGTYAPFRFHFNLFEN